MRYSVRRRLAPAAIFAGALLAISPTAALAAPGATTAAAEHGSRATAALPSQPRHAGFAAIPAVNPTSFNICLRNSNNSYCLESNGVTQQVTITSNPANWSNFTRQDLGPDPGVGEIYRIQNGNGNCLRESNHQTVVIANGRCVQSDADGEWLLPGAPNAWNGIYKNIAFLDDMLVHAAVNGSKVFAGLPGPGDWSVWSNL